MAVSKEQRTLRDFETAFLKGYQAFLKLLLDAVEGRKGSSVDRRTAVRCMCGLLRALPNFNYRTDLLRALVPLLGGEDVVVAEAAAEAVGSVLSECGGEAALEAVQLLAELVKQRGCLAPEYTLEVLRCLRFSDKLAVRLRDDREAGQPLSQKAKNRKWIEERRRLRDEAKLAVRKGGAAAPEQPEEADDRDFREFDALPDADMLLKLQTTMLEAVCEIYFRVLKAAVVPNGVHGWPLLKPTLAGLARVAFLIDYEVVSDILEVRASMPKQALSCLPACSPLPSFAGAAQADGSWRAVQRPAGAVSAHRLRGAGGPGRGPGGCGLPRLPPPPVPPGGRLSLPGGGPRLGQRRGRLRWRQGHRRQPAVGAGALSHAARACPSPG